VHHDLLGRHLVGLGHPQPEALLHHRVAAQPVLAGRPEADRLAVRQRDQPLGRLVAAAQHVEAAVVEDGAVLEDLDQRGAAVRGGLPQHGGQPGPVGVDGPPDEGGLHPERQ
jgi:hypothetical protein